MRFNATTICRGSVTEEEMTHDCDKLVRANGYLSQVGDAEWDENERSGQ